MRAWLESALRESTLWDDSRDALMGRGATREILETWQIRNFRGPAERCPDEAAAKRYGAHFEVFEERILFPLFSPRGVLLGFDSRHLDQKDEIRFLLPESQWSAVWIGMPAAMDKIWAGSDIVICEGRYDVWALYHGVTNAAVLGSGPAHLSGRQIDFLHRWTRRLTRDQHLHQSRVHFAYDIDATGKRGTKNSLKELRELGVICERVRYGASGDDPGLLWDRGGVQFVRKAFSHL